MNIWKALGISPTADKKVIKKAYAAKTKEIHPEEKPEEFKQLYEAYQAALGYAAFVLKAHPPENDAAVTGETTENAAETTEENREILSYFAEYQEKQKQCVDAFIRCWNVYKNSCNSPKILEWWKEYLASENFQDIRYHSQVLHLLTEETVQQNVYMSNEIKKLLWDAYDFREEEEAADQGALQILWKSLHPDRIRRQKKERTQQIFRGAVIVVMLLFCAWGAYVIGKGEVLLPVIIALLYYTKKLIEDMRE